MKHLSVLIIAIYILAGIILFSSCAREYDISNDNLDLNIKVGGESLTIPLGNSGKLSIADFIDLEENEYLKVSEKGEYYMEVALNVDETIDLSNYIEEVAIDGMHEVLLKDTYIPSSLANTFSRASNDYVEVELESADTLKLSYDLSKAHTDGLVDIDGILFEDAHIQLSVDMSTTSSYGIPDDVHVVIEMSLPEKYHFSEASGAFTSGKIFLQGDLDSEGHITFNRIDLEKLDFNVSPSDDFYFEDVFVLEHLSVLLHPDDLPHYVGEHIYLDIHFDVASENSDKIMASGFYGLVDKTLDPISESLDLSDLPDLFRGEGTNIDLINSYALLNISTNSGIPFVLDVTVDPKTPSNVLEMELETPSCDENKESEMVSYCISETKIEGMEEYEWYQADISKLFHPIPESVDFTVLAHTDVNGGTHYVDFHKNYFVNTELDMIVPLCFGENLYLPVCDTITDLPGEIAFVFELAKIDLICDINTNIPVAMELDFDFIDSNGNVLDVNVEGGRVEGTSQQGVPVDRQLVISIDKFKESYDFAGIIFNVILLPGETAGIPITEDCYLELDFSVSLPEGITLDLSDYAD